MNCKSLLRHETFTRSAGRTSLRQLRVNSGRQIDRQHFVRRKNGRAHECLCAIIMYVDDHRHTPMSAAWYAGQLLRT